MYNLLIVLSMLSGLDDKSFKVRESTYKQLVVFNQQNDVNEIMEAIIQSPEISEELRDRLKSACGAYYSLSEFNLPLFEHIDNQNECVEWSEANEWLENTNEFSYKNCPDGYIRTSPIHKSLYATELYLHNLLYNGATREQIIQLIHDGLCRQAKYEKDCIEVEIE